MDEMIAAMNKVAELTTTDVEDALAQVEQGGGCRGRGRGRGRGEGTAQ